MQAWQVYALLIFSLLGAVTGVVSLILTVRNTGRERYEQMLDELYGWNQAQTDTLTQAVRSVSRAAADGQSQFSRELSYRQEALQNSVGEMLRSVDGRLHQFTVQNDQQLAGIRESVTRDLAAVRTENQAQLEQMRLLVEEKLQHTLDARLSQSFSAVSKRLEEVRQGLNDMQGLAVGVGDLKRVLSNVKSRGVLGEVQLRSILEDLLAPGQYEANVVTKRGSRAFVEFAVLLPGNGEQPVYLPVDAKFPMDAYTQLLDAQESGDAAAVKGAGVQLSRRMRGFAREVREKYVDPPYTTDFAVLFLPFEGLYAEALRLGLLEQLQREFQVCLAGPATMAALLNSLQLGFRTLAIQKRSSEVWEVLGAVRTEFDRFGDALAAAQQRLGQAGDELERLVGVRTRMIRQKLAQVGYLEQGRPKPSEQTEEEEGSC